MTANAKLVFSICGAVCFFIGSIPGLPWSGVHAISAGLGFMSLAYLVP